MPEIFNGKNVADFIDPDIAEKLEALEREEEALEAQGFYAEDEEEEVSSVSHNIEGQPLTRQLDTDEEHFMQAATQVRERKLQMKQASQAKNRLQNNAPIPRKKRHLTLSELTDGMREAGVDPVQIEKRAKRLMEKKKAEWEAAEAAHAAAVEAGEGEGDSDDGMEVDEDEDMDSDDEPKSKKGKGKDLKGKRPRPSALAALARVRQPKGNRQLAGMATREQDLKATELRMFAQRLPNRLAKASESDRHVPITRPKWMLAGKRKQGTNSRR